MKNFYKQFFKMALCVSIINAILWIYFNRELDILRLIFGIGNLFLGYVICYFLVEYLLYFFYEEVQGAERDEINSKRWQAEKRWHEKHDYPMTDEAFPIKPTFIRQPYIDRALVFSILTVMCALDTVSILRFKSSLLVVFRHLIMP
jgi:hypothetical protein